MKSYKKQIEEYLSSKGFFYHLNAKNAKYYGATFYKRNAWDGEFIYEFELEDKKKQYKMIIDLETEEWIK